MPPPTPRKEKKKATVTLDTENLTLQFSFIITQTDADTSSHTHKHKHTCTRAHTGRLYRVAVSMSTFAVARRSWNLAVKCPLEKYPWQSKSQSICSVAGGDMVKCYCQGHFTDYRYLSGILVFVSSTGASQLVSVSALASSITPLHFLSLYPLFLLFIKAPRNNKSPRNWEHVMKS